MPLQDYVIRLQSGPWEVRLDDQLIGGHPTQLSALQVAQTLAHAAANNGQRSRIIVGDLDGPPMESPVVGPQEPPSASN